MLARLKAAYLRDWPFSLAALVVALFTGGMAYWNSVKADEAYAEVETIRAQQAAEQRATRE